jgi:hypothetical protein
MKLLLRACTALLVMAWPSLAGDVSYVVLYREGLDNLLRVSEDGRFSKRIATVEGGYGLALDNSGDYIVAALTSVFRVTPAGKVEKIAEAPSGSHWISVAVDLAGNYILADNRQHAVWRVSPADRTVTRVATYSTTYHNNMESVGILYRRA